MIWSMNKNKSQFIETAKDSTHVTYELANLFIFSKAKKNVEKLLKAVKH